MTSAASSLAYFTDEVISEFDGLGTESLIQSLHALDQAPDQNEDTASQIFTEMLLVYEEGRLKLELLLNFLSLAISDERYAVTFCQVLDVFPLSSSIQTVLLELYNKQNIVKSSTLARFIDPESLAQLSIVPVDVLNRQLNTRKRDDFYTQKKYNLLHEEFEGYSKYIVEIFHILKSGDGIYLVDYALRVTENLIGHYNLDPNRVLDLFIETVSNHFIGNQDFLIAFLKKSLWWPAVPGDVGTSIENLSVGGSEAGAKIIGLRLLKQPIDKDLPETYKILVAVLIKEGFVSFGSIYKYLRPNEDEMKTLESTYKKELDEKVFKASASALALAAPLVDEEEEANQNGSKDSRQKTTAKVDTSVAGQLPSNMKYQFLKAFLANGLYWPSIYILTEYPFLAYVDDGVTELMSRLLNAIIQQLHSEIMPLGGDELLELATTKKLAISKPLNTVAYENFPSSNYSSFSPTIKDFGSKKFHYFYTEWISSLPIVRNVDDLFSVSHQYVKFFGVTLSKNLEVFAKICDIAIWDLSNSPSDSRKDQWFLYFRNFLFPAVVTIEENSFATDKAFKVLSFYSVEQRFNLYGELHQVLAKNNPNIKIAYGRAEKATKDILKRLSKENVRPMMRRLAKISFSNPLPCFLTILQQIESYDNLNTLVVETARYFNGYGWDALTLAILMRLTATGRSNVQADGLNDRQWIQSLASFIGKICQRYPHSVDLKTLLSYLMKSLHNRESSSLIVLREIFISMGGIQTITNLTLTQINMINCGASLEKVVYRTIADLRFERLKSGEALIKVLLELDAVNELLVLLCQLENEIVYNSESSHLKILASKNDDLDTVIHLFTLLVTFFGTQEEFSGALLPIAELSVDYQVPYQWAYEIWRPFLQRAIDSSETNTLEDQVKAISPESVWPYLDSHLFTSFWQLSLFDINYSESLYLGEQAKLKASITSLIETLSISKRDKDVAKATLDRYRADLHQNEDFVEVLPRENELHKKHNHEINIKLADASKSWFQLDGMENIKLQIRAFVQHCILPRAIHSSFDAAYTAKFLFKLHALQTPNFSIIIALDELIRSKILFGTLFTLTPTEAENLGLFFSDVLSTLHDWTSKPSFTEQAALATLYNKESRDILTFEQYRVTLFEYHLIILEDVGRALEVAEYMSRRNAITFMKNLLGVYPNVEDHCEKVISLIENIINTEKREDLKLSSSALIGHVKSRSKTWVHLWDFIELPEDEKAELIAKRKAIADKIEKEKKEKAEKEEAARKEEARQRLEKEKEAQNQKRLASSLSYDDSGSSFKRAESRGSEPSRGRYDYYSKYDSSKNDAPPTKPNASEPAAVSSGTKKETKKDFVLAPKAMEQKKPDSHQADSNVDLKPERPASRAADLKARLLEAKKEYKESKSKGSSKGSRSATPDKETKPESTDVSSLRRQLGTSTPVEAPKRKPLPPQESIKKDEPRHPSRNTGNNNQNKYDASRGSQSASSRPSHSDTARSQGGTPRPAGSQNLPAKHQSAQTRNQNTPSGPQNPPSGPLGGPSRPNTSSRDPPRPPSAPGRGPLSLSSGSLQPTPSRHNQGESKTPQGPLLRLPLPPPNTKPPVRSSGRPPLPPPPVPPAGQKQSSLRENYNLSLRDGYNGRDTRTNYRSDAKRKGDGHGNGRSYDKKARY